MKNLLEWSRAQTGAIKLKPERIELRQLFESNLLLYWAVAENKNIFIEVNGVQANVLSDKYMLETIIRNLVSNALKFTKTNGNIKIQITENKDYVICSIQDNGIGISPKNQQKLFRIDTNYTRLGTKDESGTGLGLILCKEFIEKNGGSIAVQSGLAVGSTFTLPKAP